MSFIPDASYLISFLVIERHGYIERRERTGKREEEAHTRTPTRVKRPGQPHSAEEQLLPTTRKETRETADQQERN
jgi:hypothetical protein